MHVRVGMYLFECMCECAVLVAMSLLIHACCTTKIDFANRLMIDFFNLLN